jgi:hypothetical protein
MRLITHSTIRKYSNKLRKLSNITENDIQCIYVTEPEHYIHDLSTLKYKYGMMACHKMVLKFRESTCIAGFYGVLTKLYRTDLLICYGMVDCSEIKCIMRFFYWINYMSPETLSELSGINKYDLRESEIYGVLRKYDGIVFYLYLDEPLQKKLINMYNETLKTS